MEDEVLLCISTCNFATIIKENLKVRTNTISMNQTERKQTYEVDFLTCVGISASTSAAKLE
jgi:hypothetical protein